MAKKRRVSKKKRQQQKRILLACIAIFALFFLLIGYKIGSHKNKGSDELTPEVVQSRLENCSDLIKTEIPYSGRINHTEGDASTLINDRTFLMTYSTYLTADIDLSSAKVTIEDKNISVVLPHAVLADIMIAENDIEYYDSQNMTFTWEEKDDETEVIAMAKEDASDFALDADLVNLTETKASSVVNNLLLPLSQGKKDAYTIKVTFE